jgi:glycosyltransferase involved in cell wall biosynthesis
MVMIARNERANVRPCLDSFWDHVDEVVLCDTGSRDGTIGEARAYADERGEPEKLIVGRFKWREDFGAARTHAHSLATGDVHLTIDLDDRLIDGAHVRDVATRFQSEPELAAISARWEGKLYGEVWRQRLLRPPITWIGATWEWPSVAGPWESQIGFLTPASGEITDMLSVRHVREMARGRRDLEIALRWGRREPDNWRPWYVAAVEALDNGDWAGFHQASRRGLSLDLPDGIRALFLTQLALEAHMQGERGRAEELATAALSYGPDNALARVICASAALDRNDVEAASAHIEKAEERPLPPEVAGVHQAVKSRVAMAQILAPTVAARRREGQP